MVHTKSMSVLLFCPKLYQFIVLFAQMAAILYFINNAMSKVLSYYITISGISEPVNQEFASILSKIISFYCLSCSNGGHFGFCHFSVSYVENNFGILD